MQHKWRHWLTWRQGPQPPRARARARAREPTVFTVTWETCRRKCRTCVIAQKCNVVSASGSQVAWPDMASKCGVTCPRGVREPGGVAKRDVKMWRHWPTWRQGARWRGWSQVAWPDVASKHGVTCPPSGSQVASGRGAKTWRHLPMRRQGATWRRRTWRQNVGSLAHVTSGIQVASQDVASKCGVTCSRGREPRGVAGRGVKTWREAPSIYVASQDVASKRGVTKPRLPARVFKMCLQSSGDMCTPTGDHPVYIYMYTDVSVYMPIIGIHTCI